MKEILVISGKGGAGKTSLTAALAGLMAPCVLVDCDVDAADLHLLLQPEVQETHPFISGQEPVLDGSRCVGCGRCEELCRFEAIRLSPAGEPCLVPGACEGCGVCADHCPAEAIAMTPRQCGEWHRSATPVGTMIHARLFPGAENSGKLVAAIRKTARETALAQGCDFLLSDGPPGIGCPVIASLSGVDFALLVTEPSVSGLHDLQRAAELVRGFEVDFQVVINKADIHPAMTADIEDFCKSQQIDVAGKISYSRLFVEALRKGQTVMAHPGSKPEQEIMALWKHLSSLKAFQKTPNNDKEAEA